MSGKYLRCVVNILLYVAGLIMLVILVPRLLVFFMPFVVGWIIALLANPLVRFMERRLKMVRRHSSMVIIITAIALVVAGGYFAITAIVRELYGFLSILPNIYGSFLQDLEEIRENLQGFSMRFPPQVRESAASLTDSLTTSLGDVIGAIGKPTVEAAGTVAKNIPNALVHVIFAILSAYFFIAERDKIVQTLQEQIPTWIWEKWHFIREKFRRAIGGYFKAQFKIMGVVALILFVGFLILRIHYAVLLAILIAILDFLPFFGTGTALIPWAVLKVLSADYQFAVGLIIIYLVSQLVRQLIQPKIVGDSIGLNPLSTLFFMFIGYKVSSIFGMILAVPIGMILVSLYQAGAFRDVIADIKELANGLNEIRNWNRRRK
ncbi:sporulation integral membrane protein YtvI [bacterium 1XD21-13]|nr:sporulation integral membrane protein YtvI [bacterium 1XD21-13]